eukprot:CFRG6777T1
MALSNSTVSSALLASYIGWAAFDLGPAHSPKYNPFHSQKVQAGEAFFIVQCGISLGTAAAFYANAKGLLTTSPDLIIGVGYAAHMLYGMADFHFFPSHKWNENAVYAMQIPSLILACFAIKQGLGK